MNYFKSVILSLVFLASSFCMHAQKPATETLIGNWKIDLRPTPNAEAYFQMFIVESVESKSLKGSFYGSGLENGFINTEWEKIHFAFTTRDQNNEYYHSAYLQDGKLFGNTYCPNRGFMAPWTGTKE